MKAEKKKSKSYVKPSVSVGELLQRKLVYFTDGPAVLGLSRSTIIRRIKSGSLPGTKRDGGLNYWPTSELLEFVENQDSRPTSA